MRCSVAHAVVGVVVLAVLLGLGGQASADTAIDTTGSWDGSNHIGSFGEPNLATFGQTFTVGNDNVLKSFSFWLRDIGDPDQPDFIAYIARWSGNSIIGPILYQSPSFTVTSTPFTEFAFDTGSLILQPGAQYLAFLSASTLFDGVQGRAAAGYVGTDVCVGPGGGGDQGCGFVANDNGADFSELTTPGWIQTPEDLAFRASFSSSLPEPDDSDGDGIPDDEDVCPDTVIPESVPTKRLGVNRFALTDGDTIFDTCAPKGKGLKKVFTIADTAGCSCEQIIAMLGLGKSHTKLGCSIGAMKRWIEMVNP